MVIPRRPCICIDGVPLGTVQRGHNREPCFFGEEDYSSCLHWLGEALGEAECALHAYFLMTNHAPVVEAQEGPSGAQVDPICKANIDKRISLNLTQKSEFHR